MNKELIMRIKKLQNEISKNKLSAYIISNQESLLYFTGMSYKPEERVFFMIVPQKGTPIFLTPKLEEKHLSKISIECEVRSYWEATSKEGENWYDILAELIKPFQRIGVESSIPTNILNKIDSNDIVEIDIVDEMRKIKTAYEIEMIRNTATLADLGMKRILENAYIGASALEMFTLSGKIQKDLIRQKNFDPILTSLTSVVWPSPISSMPHSIPSIEDRLTKGGNVAMTYFKVNGYAAECERTFFLNSFTNDDREHFNHMIEARNIALNLVKPGVKCSDIDLAARNYLISKGYKDNLLHRTGHGIGLSNHEKPFVSIGDDQILKENMVISIEPGIYIDGVGGYRHSDTVLVTDKGYELLTKIETDIESMTIPNRNTVSKIKGKVIRRTLNL